jgi:hypothetical protein
MICWPHLLPVAGDGGGLGDALPGGGERGLGVMAADGGAVREVTQPLGGDDGARTQFGDGQAAVRRLAGRREVDGYGVQQRVPGGGARVVAHHLGGGLGDPEPSAAFADGRPGLCWQPLG